jgi:hypothetical protein
MGGEGRCDDEEISMDTVKLKGPQGHKVAAILGFLLVSLGRLVEISR